MAQPLVIAKSGELELALLPALANRHGLITGATGTGKTVTLQVLAERLSMIGVPVFMADVKGDLSGLGAAGSITPKLKARLESLGIAEPGEALGQCLQGDGLAGAGGARDQAVPVAHFGQQHQFVVGVLGDEDGIGHGGSRRWAVRGGNPAPCTGDKPYMALRSGRGA